MSRRNHVSSLLQRMVWVTAILLIVLPASAPAQVLYGSIVGTVSDSTGLSVPGATVKITQNETNQSREATTNETGSYTFTNVAAGTYEVDVTLPGFQAFKSLNIVVRANPAVRVDANLPGGQRKA